MLQEFRLSIFSKWKQNWHWITSKEYSHTYVNWHISYRVTFNEIFWLPFCFVINIIIIIIIVIIIIIIIDFSNPIHKLSKMTHTCPINSPYFRLMVME